MLFAKLDEQNNVLEFPISEAKLRDSLPNVSLPMDLSEIDLSNFGYVQVPPATEKLIPKPLFKFELGPPAWVDGKLQRTFNEVPRTDDEIKNQFRVVRRERNRKLALTDWTQLNDTALSVKEVEKYKVYRQKLRDIFEKMSDPYNVTWPGLK